MTTCEQPFHFIVMDSDKLERLLSERAPEKGDSPCLMPNDVIDFCLDDILEDVWG